MNQTLLNREKKGEAYALTLSILEGLFPILTLVSVAAYGALHSYFYTILFATMALLFVTWKKKQLPMLMHRAARKDMLLTSLYITLLFVLIFISLRYTTAGNVAVILVLQLFFSYLYFNIIGRESISFLHTTGSVLMGVGAVLILFPDDFSLNKGDLLALMAAAIAPVANFYQQRARKKVPSIVVLSFRNLVALPFLFLLAKWSEPPVGLFHDSKAFGFLILNAMLIFVAAKILWVESLHYITITKLSALASFIPVFTMIFAYLMLGETPGIREIGGAVLVMLGAYLLTRPE
ncbi:MAG TPA: DMT family transporter [Gammaproteobacteria bacterium]|nr:DMT family transporter [Gammaproteobacteria bacterium]